MISLSIAGRQALAIALAATGVALTAQAARAQAEPAATTPEAAPDEGDGAAAIVVTGTQRKEGVNAGALGARSVFDTPFSVGSVNADAIQRIAATTIDAAFDYDAGVRSNNSGTASGNTFSVRGIAIDRTNGYKLDGLPFPYWFQDHPLDHLQDLQVLKGAGGFAYGFAAPGGVVNLVSKQPSRDFQATFDISYRSSSILHELVDVGGPLDRAGDYGFRFNASNEEGRLYNGAYNKDQFVSLALTGHAGDRFSWQLDGFYQRTRQDDQVNTISITTVPTTVNGVTYGPVTSLAPVSGKLEPGAKGTTKLNDIVSLTGRINYRIADDWKLSAAARYAALDERFPGSLATIYDNGGDYYSTVYNMNRLFKYYVTDASLAGKFNTGPITHEILAGVSTLTSQFDYDNPTRGFVLGPNNNAATPVLGTTNAYVYNIHNANSVPTVIGNAAAQYNNRSPVWTLYQDIHQRAAFASDTATWGPVSVLVGLRYTDYEEINYNPNQTLSSYFHYRPSSPVVSASLAVVSHVKIYATYVDALQRGGLAPATATNTNASYGPLKTTQYEAGIKATGRWGNASLAVYRIATPSEYIDATNTFVRNGAARYQGVEFNAGLTPAKGVFVNTSLAWLDAKQVSGPATQIGQTIPGTTGFQASVLGEYALPFLPGVKLTGGVRHSGKSYGVGDIFVYPESTVGDIGARFDTAVGGHAVVLRANVQNLTGLNYWIPGSAGTSISAGAPRTFTMSAQVSLQGEDSPGFAASSDEPGWGGHSYFELDAGGAFAHRFNAAVDNRVTNPAAAAGAISVAQKTGWDVDGVLGHDFGRFSGEIETGFKRLANGAIDYSNAQVAVDGSGRGAGLYANGGGHSGVLSLLFNGLVNVGADQASTRGFVGGGLGLARVSSGQWTLDRTQASLSFPSASAAAAAVPNYFSDDNATAFAWQVLAGVRQRLGSSVDLVIKYRYFQIPGLTLRTTNGNQLKGDLFGSSVLAGIAWRL